MCFTASQGSKGNVATVDNGVFFARNFFIYTTTMRSFVQGLVVLAKGLLCSQFHYKVFEMSSYNLIEGGACGLMLNDVESGHGDPSSNP